MKYITINCKDWSDDVQTSDWGQPEGLFTNDDPHYIASVLKRRSNSLQQAMSRLTFYMNRAGSNLSAADVERLNAVKDILRDIMH